jgi:hypothetical protein
MKTTLNIPDALMRQLKQEAARRRTTMSELVERALRELLAGTRPAAEAPPLPSFGAGRAHVDVSNREALYEVMER